jgi:hypothetical protein
MACAMCGSPLPSDDLRPWGERDAWRCIDEAACAKRRAKVAP